MILLRVKGFSSVEMLLGLGQKQAEISVTSFANHIQVSCARSGMSELQTFM